MRTAPLITLMFLLFTPNLLIGQELNICEFGAVPEKNVLSTSAIQAAIDSCTDQGGGIVRFPSGEYQSGTIYLPGSGSHSLRFYRYISIPIE